MTPVNPDPESPPIDLSEAALRWIVRLNSGTATSADREAYRAWRMTSPEHETAAVEAEALWADMSELHVDPATGLIRPGRKPPHLSRRALLTGVVGLGVAGAGLWASDAFTRLFADYASETASTRTIALPDGSQIVLNARSAIDVLFNDGMRRIELLEGEAFFDVVADPGLPFEVAVGDITVTALGTAFDIARDLPDARAEIAVTSHAVRVRSGSSRSGADIREGESVSVDNSGRLGSVRPQDATITGAWRNGLYIADARTLAEVVSALSPWHRGSIVLLDGALGGLRVNAVLDLRDPQGSLAALEGGLPIRVRRITRFLTVISSA